MNFQIMQHDGGRKFIPAVHDVTKKPLIYDCPKKAAEVAASLTKTKGVKFQPRPIKEAVDWRKRELNRFKSGDYKPVVWIDEPWWKEIPDHFAHVGVKDPTRIAFTPDAAKGEADRQVVMLPGKYLQQFFGDKMTPEQVRDYALQHSLKYEVTDLKFATTVEDIEHVYKVGPSGSCFKGSDKANLYASGDFAVAYIAGDKDNVTARTICVPERKIYVWPYGDVYRLRDSLEKIGYRKSTDGYDYDGLKLLKKWYWRGFYADWCPSRNIVAHDDTYMIVRT